MAQLALRTQHYAAAVDLMCPATVKEALGGDHAEMWAAAMDKELESLWQNKVYIEVTRRCGSCENVCTV